MEGTLPGLSGVSWRLHLLSFPAFKATTVSLPFCCRSVCPCPMTDLPIRGCCRLCFVCSAVASRKVTDRWLLASGWSTGITGRDSV